MTYQSHSSHFTRARRSRSNARVTRVLGDGGVDSPFSPLLPFVPFLLVHQLRSSATIELGELTMGIDRVKVLTHAGLPRRRIVWRNVNKSTRKLNRQQ